MKKVILYISVTLDGFIARKDYSIDFLNNFDCPNEDYGYQEFIDGIDDIIMGNNTYKQILTFGKFPYENKNCYVFSKTKNGRDKHTSYISRNFISFVNKLKKESKKNIWLVGGAEIIELFLENNLIDEMRLFIIPILIGDGIRLFNNKTAAKFNLDKKLVLKQIKKYQTGIILMNYFLNDVEN